MNTHKMKTLQERVASLEADVLQIRQHLKLAAAADDLLTYSDIQQQYGYSKWRFQRLAKKHNLPTYGSTGKTSPRQYKRIDVESALYAPFVFSTKQAGDE